MGNQHHHSLRAFTLFEVLVVLALITGVVGVAVFSLDTYATYNRTTEQARVVSALQAARTRAMNSVEGLPSGVMLYPSSYNGYIIFSGTSYDTRVSTFDEFIPATYPLLPTAWSARAVVFAPLSGITTPATIVLTDPHTGRSSTTTITYDGYIE
jgi:Tfp pilus assembly protein FimT